MASWAGSAVTVQLRSVASNLRQHASIPAMAAAACARVPKTIHRPAFPILTCVVRALLRSALPPAAAAVFATGPFGAPPTSCSGFTTTAAAATGTDFLPCSGATPLLAPRTPFAAAPAAAAVAGIAEAPACSSSTSMPSAFSPRPCPASSAASTASAGPCLPSSSTPSTPSPDCVAPLASSWSRVPPSFRFSCASATLAS